MLSHYGLRCVILPLHQAHTTASHRYYAVLRCSRNVFSSFLYCANHSESNIADDILGKADQTQNLPPVVQAQATFSGQSTVNVPLGILKSVVVKTMLAPTADM